MIKIFLSKVKILGFWFKRLFIPCDDNNYRPKILEGKYLIYILLLACFLRLSTFLFFWQLPNTSFFADISKMVLIENLNSERSDLKLGKLKENALLNKAASLKANDMMQNGYFSHTSPTGVTPWYWFKKVGYDYKSAGENLGVGFVDSNELHQAWNESPSHKANLVNKNYKDIGISFLEGNFQGSQTIIVVQLFGAQKLFPTIKPQIPVIATTTTTIVPVIKPIVPTVPVAPAVPTPIPQPILKPTTNQGTANLVQNFASTASGMVSTVAGDSTTSLSFVATTNIEEMKGFWAGVLKFFAKDYNGLTQKIVLVFLLINIVALILNIVIKIFVQHYDLILKASLISLALILLVSIGPKEITALMHPNFRIF